MASLDKTEIFCDTGQELSKDCSALNGQVFAVGEGPDGVGLYRITDHDGDHHAEQGRYCCSNSPARPPNMEPHAVTLGPDGLLYVVLGNHTQIDKQPEATSPLNHVYEGDLITPKYEDPHGHAVGIKAPCGTIVRTDVNGSFVELFAGGLRNCYGMAFNRNGRIVHRTIPTWNGTKASPGIGPPARCM